MLDYQVLDIETNTLDPFLEGATPHLIGVHSAKFVGPRGRTLILSKNNSSVMIQSCKMLVGHNIKFDCHHLLLDGALYVHRPGNPRDRFEDALSDMHVWDTMVVEHIISGHTSGMISLEKLAAKYNIHFNKDARVQTIFENGGGIDQVIKELGPSVARAYLAKDLEVTNKIFLKQLEIIKTKKMEGIVAAVCEITWAIVWMEYHGMAFNIIEAAKERRLLDIDVHSARIATWDALKMLQPKIQATSLDTTALDSPKILSTLLFGGEHREVYKRLNGTFKSGAKKGQIKYKNVVITHHFPPLIVGAQPLTSNSTSKEYLEQLKPMVPGRVRNVIVGLLAVRELNKLITTYFDVLPKLADKSSKIHPKINQCVTRTGRLSASKPNLQNQPNGPFKRLFISRYAGGQLVSVDYKQIEVVALAHITKCSALVKDLKDGKDIHQETGKAVFGANMTDEQRRIVKRINFGLIYGGGAPTLARLTGQDVNLVRRLIKAFYNRYPGVREWQKKRIAQVALARAPSENLTESGKPAGVAKVRTCTGRELTFIEVDGFDGQPAFKPTEIKNYEIQGWATGDVVPLKIALLYRQIRKRWPAAVLVNVVHDEAIFDVPAEYVKEVCQFLKSEAIDIVPMLKQFFDTEDFDLPIEVKVKTGENWFDQHEV